MTDLSSFLEQLGDSKQARIFLPVINADERIRLLCLLQQSTPPRFHAIFRPGTLPVASIDRSTSCLITLDVAGQAISLESKIVEVLNEQTLEMVAQKTFTHEQMREYFRVDCTVPIMLRSMTPEGFGNPGDVWAIPGTTVDLSGSGLRASFTQAPPPDGEVRLELALPTAETNIVSAIASPVRITPLTPTLWDAAYRFDDISDEYRDKVIGYCLVAQRRLLRLKIQVKGS